MRKRGIISAAAIILAVGGTVGANARGGEWIDLLSVASKRSMSFGGSWRTAGQLIFAKATRGGRLEIPLAVSGSYELAATLSRVDGKEHLSWQGDTTRICPEELWGDTRANTLSLGLWNGSMRVSALKLRMTDGKRRLLKSRPAPKLTRFDPKNLPKAQGVGRPDGTPFREAAENNGLLAGFSVRYSTKDGLLTLIPIFRTKDGIVYGQRRGSRQYPDELAQTLLARDGFAVGGVIANRGTRRPIAGIKVVFMKATDGKLDPGKSYVSLPCGAPSGGRAVLLGGDGRAVIGIEGRSGSTIEQLSLVFR